MSSTAASSELLFQGKTWSITETYCLISLWGEDKVEEELSGTHRNRVIYEKVSYRMREHGYQRSWESCRTKIKNLRTLYMKAKLQNNTSGQERSKFPFFEEIDRFMGSRPIVEPEIVINAGTENRDITTELKDQLDDQVDENSDTELDQSTSTSNTIQSEGEKKDTKSKTTKKRKHNEDVLEKFMGSFVQMETMQTKLFLEQEEKRRKEEDSIELKRIEMDRQFQLQMFQMQSRIQMEMLSVFGQHMSQLSQNKTSMFTSNVGPCGNDTGLTSTELQQALNYANFPGEQQSASGNTYHNM